MIVAELSGVAVRRGGPGGVATLLNGIDWRIEDGDRWVIIGPNGAGKTTLLAILAAQLHPTAGTVTLLGETLGKVDVFELRPRIGIASQAVAARIPGHEKVLDVVLSAAYGIVGRWREAYDDTDVRRAERLLRTWDVASLANRNMGTLSEGECKRVEIARAQMTDPELLLLDEPSGGLDLAGREKLVQGLTRFCLDPAAPTTVLVTHHLEEIPQGITHAMLLSDGATVAAGPLESTLTSENLTNAYDMPLRVTHEDGRWSARSVEFAPRNTSSGSLPR